MIGTTSTILSIHLASVTEGKRRLNTFIDIVTKAEKNLACTVVVEQRAVVQSGSELLHTKATAEPLAEPLDDCNTQGTISELRGSRTANVGNDRKQFVKFLLPEQSLECGDDFFDRDLADRRAVVLVSYHVDVDVVRETLEVVPRGDSVVGMLPVGLTIHVAEHCVHGFGLVLIVEVEDFVCSDL